ncbi:MAG: UDP-N-acetylmuramoyl-tripeptide--D-alanyl-D-alanine ligase [Nitrospirae bacterium]|nr:UDP-N-acetylmuramoyl-tripeptide--D-alanyl-D-alanine ligase [Nitrospirota bacterium]
MRLDVTGMESLFTTAEILSATGGRLMRGDPTQVVSGVSIDSRTIQAGELFIAIKGERFDGHRFIYEALERGACGVLVNVSSHRIPETAEEEALLRDKILIGVTDPLSALQEISRSHRQRWTLPVIAVTGSNGKTTTKEMAAGVLAQRYVTLKNAGNINNQIGLPLTLLRLTSGHQAAVLEMGISRSGELRRLCEIALPRVGLITHIGPAHLETLGNMDAVAAAKAELLEALSPSEGVAILNRDDPFYPYLRSRVSGRVVTFGLDADADIHIEDLHEKDSRVVMSLGCRPSVFGIALSPASPRRGSGRGAADVEDSSPSDRARVPIHLQAVGRHNALNAAAAAAAGWCLGCDLDEVRRGLENFRPVAMRSEIISWEGRTIINDAYNANPASVLAALETLNHFPSRGRRIAVLGEMLELGVEASEAHRRIGRAVASSGAGFLITMGPHAAETAEEARSSGMSRDHAVVCREPAEAAEVLRRITGSGDVILIKGSRGMRMERILDHLSIKR